MINPAPTAPVIEVEALRVQFDAPGQGALKAVDGVSFAVRRGETFGIIGESGSGKSTLARAMVCLQRPTAGRILHDGADPYGLGTRAFRAHRRLYQIVFQDPAAALNPRMTILHSVCEPLEILGEGDAAGRRRSARDALERVGLGRGFADRYPHELSGGQKQRVNIARALIVRPSLLVCDEVVAALDVSIQADILNLLAELQRDDDLTYVFITHDLGVVSHVSDRIGVMYLGVLVELGPAEELVDRPRHPYTEALLSAELSPLPAHLRTRKRIMLSGEIPSPVSPPSGCRFRTRCRLAQAHCAVERPAFREITDGHFVACHFAEQLVLAGDPQAAAREGRANP